MWLFSLKKKDISLVNFLWGLGFAIQGVMYFYKSLDYTIFSIFSDKFSWEKLTFTSLIVAHGIRLAAVYIAKEYEEGEDIRYSKMRENLGGSFSLLSYPLVFLPQFFLNMLIGTVIYAFANCYKSDISHFWYWMGMSFMIFGGLFGTLADIQKLYFKHNRRNEGKIVDVGLWALCRHPNYFGEMLFWGGAFLCNFSSGILWTIISPMVLEAMIFFRSIPTVEKHMLDDYGDRYADYQKRVSMIIPFPQLTETKGAFGGDKMGHHQQQASGGEPMKSK
jgi:steroid 5-alpha reductase family enzyme